jgi:hypothetical protein
MALWDYTPVDPLAAQALAPGRQPRPRRGSSQGTGPWLLSEVDYP